MSVKKTELAAVIWRGVRTGCAAVGIALLLMLPAASMIQKGILTDAGRGWIAGGGAFLAGCASSLLGKKGGEGGLLTAAFSLLFAVVVLTILSFGLFDNGPHPGPILPVLAALGAGLSAGGIIQFNKKYTKHKRRKKEYN